MTTPFALLDSLGPKQVPASPEWHMVATKIFFHAAQTHPLRLKTLDF